MKYGYAFFDLDGTLTQSEFGVCASAAYALEKFGIKETDMTKLKRFIGPPLYYSFGEFYGITGDKAEDAIGYFRDKYETGAYKDAPVYEGMKEVLDKLSGDGIKLAVVTSKPINMAEKVVEHVGLNDVFDRIVGPGEEMKDPSKAELIRSALSVMGASAGEAVMVGDRHYDINGAKEAGVDSIGAVYGYGSEEELKQAGATYVANTPEDIYRIIRSAV